MRFTRARARTRHIPGAMNKTEARYRDYLECRRIDSDISSFAFEPVKFRLADRTYYTPDFMVVRADGLIEFHDVKGGPIEDDAAVKMKVVAELRPEFAFVLVRERPRKAGGGWTTQEIGPGGGA